MDNQITTLKSRITEVKSNNEKQVKTIMRESEIEMTRLKEKIVGLEKTLDMNDQWKKERIEAHEAELSKIKSDAEAEIEKVKLEAEQAISQAKLESQKAIAMA